MAIGADQLSGDGRFATNQERTKNRDQLRVELEAVLRTKGIAQWLGRLDAHGVPCAPVNDIATAMAQPQIALGDLLVNVELASGTTVAMMGSPLRVDGERLPIRRRPPTLGEHNAEIITSSDED
jgi:crotonobetainyl-CoA:carnitine CoA-transferase CaiB-like acyl-CoA transferase